MLELCKYKVKNIEEDVFYGCEENDEVKVIVSLTCEHGDLLTVKVPDKYLYDEGIEIGSTVFLDREGLPKKA